MAHIAQRQCKMQIKLNNDTSHLPTSSHGKEWWDGSTASCFSAAHRLWPGHSPKPLQLGQSFPGLQRATSPYHLNKASFFVMKSLHSEISHIPLWFLDHRQHEHRISPNHRHLRHSHGTRAIRFQPRARTRRLFQRGRTKRHFLAAALLGRSNIRTMLKVQYMFNTKIRGISCSYWMRFVTLKFDLVGMDLVSSIREMSHLLGQSWVITLALQMLHSESAEACHSRPMSQCK